LLERAKIVSLTALRFLRKPTVRPAAGAIGSATRLVALKVRYGEALKAFGAVGESGSTEKEHERVIKDSAEEIVSRDHRVSP